MNVVIIRPYSARGMCSALACDIYGHICGMYNWAILLKISGDEA